MSAYRYQVEWVQRGVMNTATLCSVETSDPESAQQVWLNCCLRQPPGETKLPAVLCNGVPINPALPWPKPCELVGKGANLIRAAEAFGARQYDPEVPTRWETLRMAAKEQVRGHQERAAQAAEIINHFCRQMQFSTGQSQELIALVASVGLALRKLWLEELVALTEMQVPTSVLLAVEVQGSSGLVSWGTEPQTLLFDFWDLVLPGLRRAFVQDFTVTLSDQAPLFGKRLAAEIQVSVLPAGLGGAPMEKHRFDL